MQCNAVKFSISSPADSVKRDIFFVRLGVELQNHIFSISRKRKRLTDLRESECSKCDRRFFSDLRMPWPQVVRFWVGI